MGVALRPAAGGPGPIRAPSYQLAFEQVEQRLGGQTM